jgi:Zn-dependent protease
MIGRIAGIRIGIHYTWLFALALITWSLTSYFATTVRSAPLTYWLMGACAALLLFASVLLHELSHSLMARRRGLHAPSGFRPEQAPHASSNAQSVAIA